MNTNTLNTSADPRCPYCGRPVIGTFVQGNQGHYHPECTRPPLADAPTTPRIGPPWWVPVPQYPYRITCEGVEVRKEKP